MHSIHLPLCQCLEHHFTSSLQHPLPRSALHATDRTVGRRPASPDFKGPSISGSRGTLNQTERQYAATSTASTTRFRLQSMPCTIKSRDPQALIRHLGAPTPNTARWLPMARWLTGLAPSLIGKHWPQPERNRVIVCYPARQPKWCQCDHS
jgi:hypothetical protein